MNEHQQAVFEDYKITGNSTITGKKFGVSRQRIHQIVKLFGYKKPKILKLTKEERFNLRKERAIIRFWNRVDKKSEDDCWNWNGSRLPTSYGHLNFRLSFEEKIKDIGAHRLAWILIYGEIPKDIDICLS